MQLVVLLVIFVTILIVLMLVMLLVLVWHWVGCIWWFLGKQNGTIDRHELKQMMTKLKVVPHDVPDKVIEQLFGVADINNDGKKDSEPSALATFAWRSVADFKKGSTGTPTDHEAVVSICALSTNNQADD